MFLASAGLGKADRIIVTCFTAILRHNFSEYNTIPFYFTEAGELNSADKSSSSSMLIVSGGINYY
jgi:hypothetical protein